MSSPFTVISYAHDVRQANYNEKHLGDFVCLSCGERGSLDQLFGPLRMCNPHGEAENSGWLDESRRDLFL